MATDPQHAQEWVAAGLITDAQATSIEDFEAAKPTTTGAVLEVLGYLGAVLVLIAGLIIVGDIWPDLDTATKVLIASVASVVLIAGGIVATGFERDALRRMGQVSLRHGSDFYEGIRAALVDKDGEPKWNPSSFHTITRRS